MATSGSAASPVRNVFQLGTIATGKPVAAVFVLSKVTIGAALIVPVARPP